MNQRESEAVDTFIRHHHNPIIRKKNKEIAELEKNLAEAVELIVRMNVGHNYSDVAYFLKKIKAEEFLKKMEGR